jgi:hypothetical protein
MPRRFPRWLRLPSRIALLLGVGALSAAGAKADPPKMGNEPAPVPQQSAKSFGELRVWNDAGRIYIAESGEQAQELRLGDTAEARHLRELLERNGAVADAPHVLQDRVILVGGGGKGISGGHWQRVQPSDTASGLPTTGRSNKAASGAKRPPERIGPAGKTNMAGAEKQK